MDTISKMKNTFTKILGRKQKRIKCWTPEEDKQLLEMADKMKSLTWSKIAQELNNGRSADLCSRRYQTIRNGLNSKFWTEQEEKSLVLLIKRYGKKWSKIAQYIPMKNPKQIRDQYVNKLDPNLKRTPFTPADDKRLLELYDMMGNAWTKISSLFDGKTADMIKNRFYSLSKNKKFLKYISGVVESTTQISDEGDKSRETAKTLFEISKVKKESLMIIKKYSEKLQVCHVNSLFFEKQGVVLLRQLNDFRSETSNILSNICYQMEEANIGLNGFLFLLNGFSNQ